MRAWVRMMRDESGAAAAEYALIVGAIGSVVALGAINLGNAITTSVGDASTNVQTCGGSC
ncbi:Flp family type IVb pilin [Sphingomonas arenae]|uniref:Flp family type IVb pilin n=1 Tax=Sphingomonas arenae TaxID=2812555 RepID=UPI001F1C9B77|nr:Flp family type IVb pilin [Sphingomonas arenae]